MSGTRFYMNVFLLFFFTGIFVLATLPVIQAQMMNKPPVAVTPPSVALRQSSGTQQLGLQQGGQLIQFLSLPVQQLQIQQLLQTRLVIQIG
jgi:hypothetical protein